MPPARRSRAGAASAADMAYGAALDRGSELCWHAGSALTLKALKAATPAYIMTCLGDSSHHALRDHWLLSMHTSVVHVVQNCSSLQHQSQDTQGPIKFILAKQRDCCDVQPSLHAHPPPDRTPECRHAVLWAERAWPGTCRGVLRFQVGAGHSVYDVSKARVIFCSGSSNR